MWYIAITGYASGKPERLMAAYDPDGINSIFICIGKACSLDYADYPYIYFPILHPAFYNYTTCVKSCPSNFTTPVECQTNKLIKSCTKYVPPHYHRNCFNFDFTSSTSMTAYPTSDSTFDLSTWFCLYEADIIFERACFPTVALSLIGQVETFSSAVDISRLTAWVNDLNTARYIILASFFIAFVLGYVI